MSTANEQPGSGLPEEPEAVEDSVVAPEAAEDSAVAPEAAADPETGVEADADPPAEAEGAVEVETETEDERIAREREEFDKLVVAFHGESAPDPQPHLPSTGTGGGSGAGGSEPRKIVRYPVLDPRPEWHAEIVEPTDETTADPLDYVEHYEQPDPELPQVSAATLASWTMLVGGVVFLVLHALLQWETPEYAGWLAIIGVFGGIITLMARMKPDRDDYDDPDNGAVV